MLSQAKETVVTGSRSEPEPAGKPAGKPAGLLGCRASNQPSFTGVRKTFPIETPKTGFFMTVGEC